MTNKRRLSKQLPEKLEAFVGDVLNVYKFDMGKLSLSKYDVHWVELINTQFQFGHQYYWKAIELNSDIRTTKEDSVFCDPKRIEQILCGVLFLIVIIAIP